MKLKLSFCVLLLLLTIIACKPPKNMKNNAPFFVYKYGDSSVAPEYHRSYSIAISPKTIKIEVNSYGDTLATKTYRTPANAFSKIENLLQNYYIEIVEEEKKHESCTGGTTDYISYQNLFGSKTKVFGSVYNCGRESYGTLSGDTNGFGNELEKLFVPNLSQIIAKTR